MKTGIRGSDYMDKPVKVLVWDSPREVTHGMENGYALDRNGLAFLG
ncbi:hypothetical protein [Solidesulfovibrio sp.]|nr:hypothetical protein [Solidesulfovibrio sp.]MEA4855007.1 hypothetical protein [Solidesulfovibrio sp.]